MKSLGTEGSNEWDHGLMTEDNPERAPKVIRCEHWSEELGRFGGWHHHEGPHACDWGNHDGECPYWVSVGGRPNLPSR